MRILIIEDDRKIAENIREFLVSEAFETDIANDWTSGLALASWITPYDCIVTDRLLPGIEWSEIVRRLRKKGIGTPVLMLTALDQVESRVEGLEAWADDYLPKPFSLRELLARIRALIRRTYRKSEISNELRVGEVTLSLDTKIATRNGKAIRLSRKQFELLEYLMKNCGRVVSKSEIEEHVWGSNANLWSDVVRSHIQTLRSKVDWPFEKKLIKTFHGMWYTIDA